MSGDRINYNIKRVHIKFYVFFMISYKFGQKIRRHASKGKNMEHPGRVEEWNVGCSIAIKNETS